MLSHIYFGDIPNLVSCAFSTIPIFPLFNSLFTCLCPFFYMLCSIAFQVAALLRPKNGYLVGLKCARRTRARVRRAGLGRRRQAPGAYTYIYSSCIIFVVYMYTVQSAERVAGDDSLLEFSVPSSHGSKD